MAYNLLYIWSKVPGRPLAGYSMHMIGLAIAAFVGIASFAVISVVIYAGLPEAAFDCAARHGRFTGLGTETNEPPPPPRGTRSATSSIGLLEIARRPAAASC